MVSRRKQLRNRATEAEKLLWVRLRKSQLGVKFIRQFSIENYVVDFYCPSLKLAIELDGQSHINKQEYDKYRTKLLKAYGVKEIRFWNHQIINSIENVLDEIKAIIKEISPP
ncbi:endonuclease domain-containing protein [Candidatus Amesbacteria bacterium]|nr:endonuclease domain-containing protein [Candidatus Amesbacteria bacterium]MBI2587319.1 endonuclease domain-containing protein [Candidatus Amesbacteria bacterium]